MSKAVKKKSRRMWRTVRKTLGTLFLVSALVIAAIPVDNLRAEGEDEAAATLAESVTPETTIPDPRDGSSDGGSSTVIYTTADTRMNFIYIPERPNDDTSPNACVIVRFEQGQTEGGTYTIPNEVDAYRQYTKADGQSGGFAAVGMNNNFLFYRNTREKSYPTEDAMKSAETTDYVTILEFTRVYEKDDDGNDTTKVIRIDAIEEYGDFNVCSLEYKDENWEGIIKDEDLYYFSGTAIDDESPDGARVPLGAANKARFTKVGQSANRRLKNVSVNYISDYYYTTDDTGKVVWKDVENSSDGIFANATNITNVSFGKEFKAVGDYAFYKTGIGSIKFDNGLTAIGKGAFQDCVLLNDVSLQGGLQRVGERAFSGCTGMTGIDMPYSVREIGDSAFEGCIALTSIGLCNTSENGTTNLLDNMGRDIFKGCRALQSVTYPYNYQKRVYLSAFRDCVSLQFICARNENMEILPDNGYGYTEFKNQLGGENTQFYFEGIADFRGSTNGMDAKLHTISKDNSFAFSYIYDNRNNFAKQNKYERTIPDDTVPGATNTFLVAPVDPENPNSSDAHLVEYSSTPAENGDQVKSLTIPQWIGKYSISELGDNAFSNSCNLETVVIPNTMKTIGAGAFQGCHALTGVIFDFTASDLELGKNIEIKDNAFQTQNFTGTTHSCGGSSVETENNMPVKKLSFVGPISPDFGPFDYAMSKRGDYSYGDQTESYITYYTGWPYNLKVEYDADADSGRGRSELTDFPALTELSTYAYSADVLRYYYSMPKNADYGTALGTAYGNYGDANAPKPDKDVANAALNVVIPNGVNAIDDGLFYKKGELNQKPMSVTACTSIGEIKGSDVDGEGTFAGCKYLKGFTLNPVAGDETSTITIGDHAFWGCKELDTVSIANVKEPLGIRPFAGCEKLSFVNFPESTKYVCSEKSVIYEMDDEGNRYKLIECLEGRASKTLSKEEVAQVTELAKEALMGCKLQRVNLLGSGIKDIPDRAFADTKEMQSISLPMDCKGFGSKVYDGTSATYISMPYDGQSIIMTPDSFDGIEPDTEIGCVEGSFIYDYFIGRNGYPKGDPDLGDREYTVIFKDYNEETKRNEVVDSQKILDGKTAKVPTPKGREGMTFVGWASESGELILPGINLIEVSGDVTYTASYDLASPGEGKYLVRFFDEDRTTLLREFYVEPGTDITTHEVYKNSIPTPPTKEGFIFTEWSWPLTNIDKDLDVYAQYRQLQEGECLVRYIVDGKVYLEQGVFVGSQAYCVPPEIEGKRFLQWVPELGIVTKDTDYTAIYVDDDGSNTGSGNNPNNPNNPGNTGSGNGTNNPNNPSGGNTGSGNGTNNPNNPNGGNTGSSNNVTRHTLQVRGGSGSGYYAAGEQIIITADEPARGQQFSSWTVSPTSTTVTDKTQSSFILTMPNNDVAVIANYKARPTSGTSSTGSGNSSNTNSNRPNGSTGTVGGTTVVIDKNGLSNTGVVSATVNGSSDNFTIKVTDSSSATEAILRALQAEYGTLDNIKYFPMDISLYDSTGTTKLTDTTGLSVSITLPLPDSLITYAGNNKVAGVVNDRLDKLTPRFTTINGVACITFTAEHFSPYVIYVDIANLSDGTISDNTPTTGDGIHPKWFLSIGLACLSFVMFMMKDNRNSSKKKQKVAVRARH